MILPEFIVEVHTVVTQPGQDGHEHIVLGVIKLLIVLVALIVIGRMLVICIRSILNVSWSGTEYGTWPGLKKWTGRKSMPNEEKPKLLVHSSAIKLIEELKKMNLPFEITPDEFCPPGTMYLLDPKHLIHPGKGSIWKSQTPPASAIQASIEAEIEIVQTKMKSSFSTHKSTQTIFKELGLCGKYPADFDYFCIAQAFHQGEHLWISGQLLSTLDSAGLAWLVDEIKLHPEMINNAKGIWWEGQHPYWNKSQTGTANKILKEMYGSALQSAITAQAMIETAQQPHHPKTKKWGLPRSEKHQAVIQLLNQELAPFHLEPDETWLEVLNPQKFTFDWLVDKLFQIIEDEDYEIEE